MPSPAGEPPTTPRAILSRWLIAFLFSIAVSSCGEETEVGPLVRFERLEFQLEKDVVEEPSKAMGVLLASDEPAPWTPNASTTGLGRWKRPDGSVVDATTLQGRREVKFIRAPIPEAARKFSRVIVEVAVSEGPNDRVSLYLYRDGERLMDPLTEEINASEELQLITFSVPAVLQQQLKPDEIGVAMQGRCTTVAFASIRFERRPLSTFVPPPTGDGVSERIGTLALRSFGLIAGQVLATECTVDEQTRVELSLGLLPSSNPEGSTVDVNIEASSSRGTKRKVVPVEYGSWKSIELDSDWLGMGDVRLRVTTGDDVVPGRAAVLIGAPCVRRPDAAGAPLRPEETVLLITSDTHRADHVGIVSSKGFVSTPSLDTLARSGVLFTDCSSQTNVTLPSHIALLTGHHVIETGILSNGERLASSVATLAEVFAAAGYETGAAVSVTHIGSDRSGLAQGFDRFDGPSHTSRDGGIAVDTVADWMTNLDDGPGFFWLHLFDAHSPYSPPEGYDRRYWSGGDPFAGESTGPEGITPPGWIRGLKQFEFPAAQYRAEVDYLDGALSRVLQLPRARDGVVAFTSDHGESLGEHGLWWSHSTLRPSVTHIPLIMSWPGAPKGVRVEAPVRQMDVGRTLLARCGIDSDFGGRDLAEAIDNAPPPSPRYLLSARHNSAAIKHDGWLFLLMLRPQDRHTLEVPEKVGQAYLYHIAEDPTAQQDLLLEEFDRAQKMRTALIQWLDSAPSEKLVEEQVLTEADKQSLIQLGYSGDEAEAGTKYWNPEFYCTEDWQVSPRRRLFEDETFTVQDYRRAVE